MAVDIKQGTAFGWYISLSANSVHTWNEIESKFHTQFYRTKSEVSLLDLSRLVQEPGEAAAAYIARFKKARHRCKVALSEVEFV
ncbi:hypothetical protein CRG98_009544 [Punica granatum]|uniref:Retrotransposon gag domain-containing protein n=1 Tax=Punica granatum TaxID=22663 RepID=A0A2I0KNL3_PUNGR|nr:hypothetical protein CRG98_009544 [Punica granatum]